MRNTLNIVFCSLIAVIISCSSNEEEQENEMQKDQESDTEEITEQRISTEVFDSTYIVVDSSLSENIHIEIIGSYGEFNIMAFIQNDSWDTTYNFCESLRKRCPKGYGIHEIRWSTDNFVGIREGCGSSCNYEIVIPFVSGYQPSSYLFAYTPADNGIELEDDLIAYNGTTNTPDGYPMIKIRNLRNGKVDSIAVDDTWEPRVCMNDFIDTLFATKTRIMIGQYGSKGILRTKKEREINLN